ncbi:MAG: hypothetical protein JNL33_09870 [Betaproteobacteria bacterium]|nr:hypothetical protein [Betaproteobacteria bacterium]
MARAPDAVRRALLAGIALVGSGASIRARAHGVTLHVHHGLPENSALHARFLLPWTQALEEASGARLRMHLNPASSAAQSPEALLAQVQEGTVDLAWVPVSPAAGRMAALGVFEFPFSVRRAEGASRALSEFVRVNDLEDRAFDGVRLLGIHATDPAVLHWARPDSPAALTGRRIAARTDAEGDVLRSAGAVVVAMDEARMAEALQKGEVEGALLSWERAALRGVDRAATMHVSAGESRPGIVTSVGALVMNPDMYRGLPDDLKAVFNANAGIATSAWLGRAHDEAAAAARQAAASRGDPQHTLTVEEFDRWQLAARSSVQTRTAALEKSGVKVKLLADSAREYLDQYDAAK